MKLQNQPDLISVVIPCRGHSKELRNCLEGLVHQQGSVSYEVIVVDSAADPAVVRLVVGFPKIRLVRSQAGLLPGEARNLGAHHALGRYLAFIDADCVPEATWLAAAFAALSSGAVLVGGPVLDNYPFHPIAVADNLLQFVDFSAHRPDGAASYFPGCNVALRQAAFQELEGFPGGPMAAGEDILFTRAAAIRWPEKVRFVQNMRVRHNGRVTFRAFLEHQEHFGFWRGVLDQELRPLHHRFGQSSVGAAPIAYKRLGYITFQMAQQNPIRLLKLFVLLPLLLAGLTAWAKGFRRGCRSTLVEVS